jgi:hypothetical protein
MKTNAQRQGLFVTPIVNRMGANLVRIALALVSLTLAACGGGVSGPAAVIGGPLTITPAAATVYSGLPTTFVVSGGTGSYFITSNDQSIVPNTGLFTSPTFTIVPGSVSADTPLSLILTDTGANAAATAALTVKPRTVGNTITITPSASQSAACGTAICAGGDAEVKATLSQAGVPLVNREVRFQVISGDFRIITSAPGAPEVLSLEGTAFTDATGTARIRIRVLSDAAAQTGLLQITDVSSGFSQRTSVAIAPSSNAPLNAQPNTIAFKGRDAGTCASGISADVIVFGGRPPYQISQPGPFSINPIVVATSGGRFTVTATGQCSSGSQIAVVDANGATVTVTASNALSDAVVPTPPTPTAFSVTPDTVTLSSCTDVASVILVGGTGNYFAASGNSAVSATVNGTQGVIRRTQNATTGPVTSPVSVAFSDGQTARQVTVNLTGTGAGICL